MKLTDRNDYWSADRLEEISASAHARHDHAVHEVSHEKLSCPEQDCWWNEPALGSSAVTPPSGGTLAAWCRELGFDAPEAS